MTGFHDTIVALATPVGTSAVAVIRVSGPDTAGVVESIFRTTPLPRRVRRGDYHDLAGTVVDDVLYVFYQAPKSYTAEDSLEINCHGNPFVVQKILEDLHVRGCRFADPGEFTQRAFVNGRIDLSQAEAVLDVIHASGDRALAAANQQLRGGLARRIDNMITELLAVLAHVEAYIDFPDEDLPAEDAGRLQEQLQSLLGRAKELLATRHYGNLLRDGIKTVIVGAPNVGKSSLLNRLIGHDRALVSAEPGTTRDFIEERIIVGPYCLRFIDTAGINQTPQPLEKLGMEKTMECAKEADIIVLVIDASMEEISYPQELEQIVKLNATILALNKADLNPHSTFSLEPRLPVVRISAATGLGIPELTAEIARIADRFRPDQGGDLVVINARHAQALADVVGGLGGALDKLAGLKSGELVASDLRDALNGLGEIRGKVDNERMLDQLFADFCIGK